MERYDVVIIGSGLGGLLCARILSKEGFNVCILEKNSKPGGSLQTFKRKGIIFDTGVHVIGGLKPGQNLHRYFSYFGLIDKLKFRQLNLNKFDVISLEGEDYPLAQGFENFREQLLTSFPDASDSLTAYTSKLKEVASSFPLYNLEYGDGLQEERYKQIGAFEFFKSIATIDSKNGSHPKAKSNKLLSSVLAGNNFLYAGDSKKTPLYIPCLINHSFISSAWRVEGGSDQITDQLIKLIENAGGKLATKREAKKISLENGEFNVTDQNGTRISSKYLISGIHPQSTLQLTDDGLFRKPFTQRINGLEETPGAFSLYIVLKQASFKHFDYNYYFHTSENVWQDDLQGKWPTSYLLITPDVDKTNTFAKSAVIMTQIHGGVFDKWARTRSGERGADYEALKNEKANELLAIVEKQFPAFRSKIEYMEISTPLTWRDYTGSTSGSMYGVARNFNAPLETQVLHCTKIPGFYFTGQNINLHGVMGVTIGAVMTCGEIIGINTLLNKIRNG